MTAGPAEFPAVIRTGEAHAMARARELGAAVLGTTSPNPPVGAVILAADGTPAGEGATAPPGGPHAEVTALTQAGDRARGGTAVVTLEPCAHTGRTGPCADALIAAGIARVVVAVPEPTEFAGGGADRLRAAGVDVELGVEEDEAAHGALAAWLTGVRQHRPYVVWKAAATLDGRVAAADGSSRWVTGGAARAAVHRLRATCDAVVVGSGTATTTRATPAARIASAQGPVRPVCAHGSRVTTTVPPRARSPACWSARTSACGPPGAAVAPSPTGVPSAARTTAPTGGLGLVLPRTPSASARARAMADRSAGATLIR